MALRGAEELGLDGVFGFQFKESRDGSVMLLECNPRVQGTMVTSVLAGANVVWAAVNDALGRPPLSIPAPRIGTRLRRYWGGVDDAGTHIMGPA
jgi:biotin carboxylase